MDSIMQHTMEYAACYIYDIIIFSRTEKEHEPHIEEIVRILHRSNLKMNDEKFKWRQSETEFLGFNISNNACITSRIEAILNLLAPTNAKSLRGFIGTATFYQWMIQKLSETISPMHNL